MKLKSVKDIDVKGKTVLVRADFNLPKTANGFGDDLRIRRTIPTLDYLVKKNCKIVIISHFSRPDGWDKNFSLREAAEVLAGLMKRKFISIQAKSGRLPEYDIPHLYFFPQDIEKQDINALIGQMRKGDIAVLENLRFYPGEEQNSREFAEKLAGFADVYINEAFSASHRNHASITGLPELLPSAAGGSLLDEINFLIRAINHPKKPVVTMMGGVKLSGKIEALENLAKISEKILLGGGIANLLLKTKGYEVGKSKIEKGQERTAKDILRNYKDKIVLPLDVVVGRSMDGTAELVKLDGVKPEQYILDIGPATIRDYSRQIRSAKTLIWNGPMGYFEKPQFRHGTFALARFFASRSKGSAYGIVGGGETLQVIGKLGLAQQIDHVSTGGGAMLDFLAGKELPGLAALAGSK